MGRGTDLVWRFGAFAFRPAAAELRRDGETVEAEPQSLRLLEFLIRNRDRVVTRDDLVAAIWDGRAISDWAVSAAVKALRAALGDPGREGAYVRTVHGIGYRFVAEVAEADTGPGETVFVRRFRSGDDGETAYLADGLTEDLIADLSHVGGLRLMSYSAACAIGEGEIPPSLGVTRIVDGGVRRHGEALRITVNLLDATGVRQIWAERFDLPVASFLAAQDRIGARVAELLAPGRPERAPGRRPTANPEAYDAYLKGRYAYFKYEPAAFQEALGHFARAVEHDPGFAAALAQMAYCRTTLYVFGLPGADRTLADAEALARRAIALDDGAALGHARLGWVLGYGGDRGATVAAFEAAMARDPGNPEIRLAYGETMNRLADPERALPLIEAAFAGDHFAPPSWEFARGHARLLLRQTGAAIRHFEAVIARLPGFVPARVQLVRARAEAGDPGGAVNAVADLRGVAPRYGLGHAARMFPYPVPAERAALRAALSAAGLA